MEHFHWHFFTDMSSPACLHRHVFTGMSSLACLDWHVLTGTFSPGPRAAFQRHAAFGGRLCWRTVHNMRAPLGQSDGCPPNRLLIPGQSPWCEPRPAASRRRLRTLTEPAIPRLLKSPSPCRRTFFRPRATALPRTLRDRPDGQRVFILILMPISRREFSRFWQRFRPGSSGDHRR